MQSVSDSTKDLLARYAKIALTAYLNGQKVAAGIGSCELSAACGDAEAFSFGNACATNISIILSEPMPDIKGTPISITWAVDDTEYPLFTGKVEDAIVRAGRTSVDAWDAMYYGGSNAFIPSYALRQDVDAAEAFKAVAAAIGVTAEPEALIMLAGVTITGGLGHLSETNSNSAVAGYIAGLVGGSALIDRSGQLTICKYTLTDYETEPYAGGASAQNVDYTLSGITMQRTETVSIQHEDGSIGEEDQTSEFFAGDGSLMVSNPLADQAAADRAFEALQAVSFRPGAYSFPGGILLDPADVITVHSMDGSYIVAVVTVTMSFDGGVKTSVSCGGEPAVGGAQGPINQALATLYADFARLQKLVAENADIVNARISNLSADDIVAGKIHSTDFATIVLDELYPETGLFPSSATYPNNGEQIVRGFEIDFSSGIIRGVFWSESVDALSARITSLEGRMAKLENSLLYPVSSLAETEVV